MIHKPPPLNNPSQYTLYQPTKQETTDTFSDKEYDGDDVLNEHAPTAVIAAAHTKATNTIGGHI